MRRVSRARLGPGSRSGTFEHTPSRRVRGCGRRAHALCWISLPTHFESKSRRRSRCSRRRLSHLCVVIGAAPCTGRASFQKQSSMWIRHAESPARQRSAQASSCRSSRSFQAICRSWFSGTAQPLLWRSSSRWCPPGACVLLATRPGACIMTIPKSKRASSPWARPLPS